MEAFTVARDVPNRDTDRTKVLATSRAAPSVIDRQPGVNLPAFPALFDGDAPATRQLRADGCQVAWGWISAAVQAELGSCDAQAFTAIAAYVSSEHEQRTSATQDWPGRIVPTAVTVAGGINLADHTQTFQGLRDAFCDQGCYTALLHARDFTDGAAGSHAVAAVLSQLAPHMAHASMDSHGLASWYRQELTAGLTQPTPLKPKNAQAPAEALASPLHRLGLQTPPPAKRASRRLSGSSEGTSLASDMRKVTLSSPDGKVPSLGAIEEDREGVSSATPDSGAEGRTEGKRGRDPDEAAVGRRLRIRAASGHQAASSQAQDAGAGLPAQQRPVVVIVPSVEGLPPRSMQDFILVVSELQREVPITLVLGVATSASALGQLLPVAACDRLRMRAFPLMPASKRLDAVVAKILLSGSLPVFFGHKVLRSIHQRCMQHDATAPSLLRALHVACIAHFQNEPLSFLAAAEDLQACCAGLPGPVVHQGLQGLPKEVTAGAGDPSAKASSRPRRSSKGATPVQAPQGQGSSAAESAARLHDAVVAVRTAYVRFAVAVLWTHAANSLTSCREGTQHSIFELLVEASSSQFMTEPGKQLVAKLVQHLGGLDCGGLQEAVQKLQAAAALVPQGPEAMQDTLQALQEVGAEVAVAASSAASALPQRHAADADSGQLRALPQQPTSHGGAGGSARPRGQRARAQALEASLQAAVPAASSGPSDGRLPAVKQAAQQLAKLVQQCLEQHLAVCPSQLPGARWLCCEDQGADMACLSMAPRHATHTALMRPDAYLAGGMPRGRHPGQEDACIAYDIFLEYGETFSLLDWFMQFCAVFNSPREEDDDNLDAQKPAQPLVKQRKRGSRKVLVPEEPSKHMSAAAEASRQPRGKRAAQTSRTGARGPEEDAAQEHCAVAKELSKPAVPVQELAARFEAATSSLQLLGLVRPATARGNGFAQKLVFMPGSQTSAAGAAEHGS